MDPKTHILIFDLDGTLAASKQPITSDMGETIKKLLKVRKVAIMSGAGFAQFEKQFFPGLPADANLSNLYIFAENAAQCYAYKDGWHTVYDETFTAPERDEIIQKLKAALAEVGMADDPTPVWGARIEDRGAQISFSPLGQQAPLEAKQKWHDLYNETRVKIHNKLELTLPHFANSMGGITTIDITRRGINKAYGIKMLMQMTGTPIEHMTYVGDALSPGGNDSVVLHTGVATHEVKGPEDTVKIIESVLAQK
jgi:phosphomannomutase